jgi:phosphatidate cytidylyltransferase
MKISSIGWRSLYVVVTAGCMFIVWQYLYQGSSEWRALPVISLFWWLTAIVWVLTYPKTASRWSHPWVLSVIGLFVLIPAWLAVVGLHGNGESGPYFVIYLLSLIWVADSSAYFGGRRWGKRKLASAVSPGKTWEGAISAIIFSIFYALLAAYLFDIQGNQWLVFVVLSQVTVVFSIFGDLTESMFKRHAGIKDSGAIIPGHGGILDRIDSVVAAAPVFVVGVWLGGFDFGGGGIT